MTDTRSSPGTASARTPEESFDGLLLEADWIDMHGGDHHDDSCEVCRDIANVRSALHGVAQGASGRGDYDHGYADGVEWATKQYAPSPVAGEAAAVTERVEKITTWLREPDWVEEASLDWLMDWMNRRPIAELAMVAMLMPGPVVPSTHSEAGK